MTARLRRRLAPVLSLQAESRHQSLHAVAPAALAKVHRSAPPSAPAPVSVCACAACGPMVPRPATVHVGSELYSDVAPTVTTIMMMISIICYNAVWCLLVEDVALQHQQQIPHTGIPEKQPMTHSRENMLHAARKHRRDDSCSGLVGTRPCQGHASIKVTKAAIHAVEQQW